jgi:colanic acid/amylovoran biosynthesis glycosyltransferase
MRLGYVVKRYPRFSETFIVNEILAHERAGVPVHVFAVRRVNEPHFQSILGDVRAPVTYISDSAPKAEGFWETVREGASKLPGFWRLLDAVQSADVADLQQGIQLALCAREAGLTHLHAHFATVATRIARLASRFADLPYSFTGHAKDLFHDEVDGAVLRRLMTDASAVVTVSDYNCDFLRQAHGSAADRVVRIYNGLPLSGFPFARPARNSKQIVAVGRLVEKKGFDILIEACAILKSRRVAFDCRIIGEGPEGERLREMIASLGLEREVTMPGPLPRPEVVRAFAEAAMCVMPCVIAADGDRDGLPTVLVEAMALGTPCIATDVTGIPELVRDQGTGLCVAQRDPAALAGAMTRLLGDPALRERLAARARALVEAEFDVERNAAVLRQLFWEARPAASPRLRAAG